jgi:hypothetical protein
MNNYHRISEQLFCEKAKVKVRHKPSVISKKRSVTATLG